MALDHVNDLKYQTSQLTIPILLYTKALDNKEIAFIIIVGGHENEEIEI